MSYYISYYISSVKDVHLRPGDLEVPGLHLILLLLVSHQSGPGLDHLTINIFHL